MGKSTKKKAAKSKTRRAGGKRAPTKKKRVGRSKKEATRAGGSKKRAKARVSRRKTAPKGSRRKKAAKTSVKKRSSAKKAVKRKALRSATTASKGKVVYLAGTGTVRSYGKAKLSVIRPGKPHSVKKSSPSTIRAEMEISPTRSKRIAKMVRRMEKEGMIKVQKHGKHRS